MAERKMSVIGFRTMRHSMANELMGKRSLTTSNGHCNWAPVEDLVERVATRLAQHTHFN